MLAAFFALSFSVVGVNAQTSPAPPCQRICPKTCSKTTAVVNDDKANTADKKMSVQEESTQAMTVSLTEAETATTTDVVSPLAVKGKTNCDPANCDPSKCDPTNCDPANCDLSKCPKKKKEL